MEKTQIKLSDTMLENVLKFLFSRLKSGSGNVQERTIELNDYADGIARNVTYHNHLMQPHLDTGKLTVKEHYYIMVFPGKTDLTAAEIITNHILDGLVFTGLQLQTNTVLLELEYLVHWQDLVNSIFSELRELFPDSPQPPRIDPGQSINTLADKLGGTVIYGRDDQGRIIPYSVNPNSGFVFEIGQDSIALKPVRTDVQYPVDSAQDIIQADLTAKPEKPEKPSTKIADMSPVYAVISDFLKNDSIWPAKQEHVLVEPSKLPGQDEKPKQKGRYRLTDDEIKKRKQIVKDANEKKNESTFMTWKQVASEMDIPERTLRDYRHNPIYQ